MNPAQPLAEAMAIGYDLVRGHLTPQQDALLRAHLEAIGSYIYSASNEELRVWDYQPSFGWG